MIETILKYALKNKATIGVILTYSLLMSTVIDWGIPNINHPYNYHMDEWHQLQSIKSLFTHGTPNVPGSANGTIFQFLLSGIYLSPFVLFKIIDPFFIKSGVESLLMQKKIFEILRLNTLIFGMISLFTLSNLVRKYFKANPFLALFFFTVTPVWLSLGNYFKYDIALVFWIILSLFYFLKYGSSPTLKNYILAGIFCSLAIATKISALPLFAIYIFSFFYFSFGKVKKYKNLFIGLVFFVLAFLLLGIPDLILQKGDYREYLYSNLVKDPAIFDNYILEYKPWWMYMFFKIIPLNFGYIFSGVLFSSLIYWSMKLFPRIVSLNFKTFRNEIFIFISMVVFIMSLTTLKLGANGNRLLVLLPFFAILSSLFILGILKHFSLLKIQIYLVFIVLLTIQFLQSTAVIYAKWQADPRQLSSDWIIKNISKGSTIGIENIPIYQLLPDVIVREFYSSHKNDIYKYEIISAKSVLLPNIVVITNKELDYKYFKKSPKKFLVERLNRENYKIVKEIKPSIILYKIMGNEFAFYSSGIVPIPTITIYSQDKNS